MSTGAEEGATRRHSHAGMMGAVASDSSAAEHPQTALDHTWSGGGGKRIGRKEGGEEKGLFKAKISLSTHLMQELSDVMVSFQRQPLKQLTQQSLKYHPQPARTLTLDLPLRTPCGRGGSTLTEFQER